MKSEYVNRNTPAEYLYFNWEIVSLHQPSMSFWRRRLRDKLAIGDFAKCHVMPFCQTRLLFTSSSLISSRLVGGYIEKETDFRYASWTSGQSSLTKAAPNDPVHTARGAHCTRRRRFKPRNGRTDTANIGNNSLHLMHSMQPKLL